MLSINPTVGIIVSCIACFQLINALSYSNSSSTLASAATFVAPPSSQIPGPILGSTTSTFPSTLPQVSEISFNVSDTSTNSRVSTTSYLHGIHVTAPSYMPEPAYLSGATWLTQAMEPTGGPVTDIAVPVSISLKVSTVSNFNQCIASASSYDEVFSQFQGRVDSAVHAGVYSTSIWTLINTVTKTIAEYGFSARIVDTETFTCAWTTAWITTMETVTHTLTSVDIPTLETVSPKCAYTEWPCGGCTIAAASLQLIYWPVSSAEGNPSSTISWTGTTPRVGLYKGNPYTSGSVYLSYKAVSAIISCSILGHGLRTGPIVTMASDDVSSLIGDGTYFTAAEMFNYANLNYPYAWTAYEQALDDRYPGGSGCQFEVAGAYNPYISQPQKLRDLDPAWADCTIAPNAGSWDPPDALQPIEGTPTPPSPVYTRGPVAGATPISPIAQSTLAPIPIPTAADGLPQPKPWTPVPVSKATPANSPVPDSPDASPPANVGSSGNVDPPLGNPSPSLSTQKTSSDPSPANPATPQQSTPSPAPQPRPTGPPIITFRGTPLTSDSTSAYTIGSQTLIPGGPAITISSTALSLAPSATALAIGSATIPLQLPSPSAAPVITLDHTAYTANSASAFILGTQTLVPGGPAITNAGTILSLAPAATAIAIGDITIPLRPPTPPAPQITIGNSIYSADLSSAFLIGTQTLLPGGPPLTISGTVISLFPSATALVVGGFTLPLSPLLLSAGLTVLTLGSTAHTATTDAAGALVIASQTLLPGGAVTVAGTVLSLDLAGTAVVVGGASTVSVGVAITGTGTGTATGMGTQTVAVGSVGTSQAAGGYMGLGGVVVSEYGATPTGCGRFGVGSSRMGGNGNGTGATATATGSGSGINEFVGGAVRTRGGGGVGDGVGWNSDRGGCGCGCWWVVSMLLKRLGGSVGVEGREGLFGNAAVWHGDMGPRTMWDDGESRDGTRGEHGIRNGKA